MSTSALPPSADAALALTVRPYRPDDAAAVQAIYAPYVLTSTATFELEPPGAAEMHGRLQPLVNKGYPVLVAERQGTVIGYAYAGPYHRRPAYGWTVENSIYLDQNQRRGGAGTALMGSLIAASETAGFRQMIAVIGDRENIASLRLHTRHGFRPIGVMEAVGYKFGRWLDVTYMQRALGAGADSAPIA